MNRKTMAAIGAGAAVAATAPVSIPLTALVGATAIVGSIYAALQTAQEEVKAAESSDAESLEMVVRKQQLLVDFQLSMARVAQEVSIANRISQSNDVEIEEFYDQSRALGGELGGSVADKAMKLGANSDSKNVVKRIYKFNGLPSSSA